MRSFVTINDTQVAVGEERLSVTNPLPALPFEQFAPLPPLTRQDNTLDVLAAQQDAMMGYIRSLEARIVELESRTWWSMLKTQVKSWFGR